MDDPAGRARRAERRPPRPAARIPAGLDATLVLVRHGESAFIVRGPLPGPGRHAAVRHRAGARPALVAERLAPPHAARRCRSPPAPPLEIVHSPLAPDRPRPRGGHRRGRAAGGSAGPIPVRPDPRLRSRSARATGRASLATRSRRATARELAAWRRTPTEAWAPGGESPARRPGAGRARRSRDLLARARRRPAARARSTAPQVAGYGDAAADQPWSIVVGHDGVFKVAAADPVRPAARAVLDVVDRTCAGSRSSSSGPAGRSSGR